MLRSAARRLSPRHAPYDRFHCPISPRRADHNRWTREVSGAGTSDLPPPGDDAVQARIDTLPIDGRFASLSRFPLSGHAAAGQHDHCSRCGEVRVRCAAARAPRPRDPAPGHRRPRSRRPRRETSAVAPPALDVESAASLAHGPRPAARFFPSRRRWRCATPALEGGWVIGRRRSPTRGGPHLRDAETSCRPPAGAPPSSRRSRTAASALADPRAWSRNIAAGRCASHCNAPAIPAAVRASLALTRGQRKAMRRGSNVRAPPAQPRRHPPAAYLGWLRATHRPSPIVGSSRGTAGREPARQRLRCSRNVARSPRDQVLRARPQSCSPSRAAGCARRATAATRRPPAT